MCHFRLIHSTVECICLCDSQICLSVAQQNWKICKSEHITSSFKQLYLTCLSRAGQELQVQGCWMSKLRSSEMPAPLMTKLSIHPFFLAFSNQVNNVLLKMCLRWQWGEPKMVSPESRGTTGIFSLQPLVTGRCRRKRKLKVNRDHTAGRLYHVALIIPKYWPLFALSAFYILNVAQANSKAVIV